MFGYKIVNEQYMAPIYGTIQYKVGQTIYADLSDLDEKAARSDDECGPGLNIFTRKRDIGPFIQGYLDEHPLLRILRVSYEVKDVYACVEKKTRLSRLKVLKQVGTVKWNEAGLDIWGNKHWKSTVIWK